jgi:flagellar motility protein MotE (MotC chaperone)
MIRMSIVIVVAFALTAPTALLAQNPTPKPITGPRPAIIDRLPQTIKSMPRTGFRGAIAPRTVTRPNCDLSIEEALLVAELRAAISKLHERRSRLDAREAALKALQTHIQEQLKALRSAQEKLEKTFNKDGAKASEKAKALAENKARDRQARIVQLAAILKKMKPGEAALIIEKTSDETAVAALAAVGARAAGKILGKLSPDRAASITKALVEQPVKKEQP